MLEIGTQRNDCCFYCGRKEFWAGICQATLYTVSMCTFNDASPVNQGVDVHKVGQVIKKGGREATT